MLIGTLDSLTISPIGYLHTPNAEKFTVPHQPDHTFKDKNDHALSSYIELLPNKNFERSLEDLSTFSHIWLIWWFHKNKSWRTNVLPPRGPARRRGVFSTRSPHRPNLIGITAVELLKVEGLNIYIGNNDLINNTPIFDIKPYLITADSFPNASIGWLKEVEEYEDKLPQYKITFSDVAKEQLSWLKGNNQNFFEQTFKILEKDPLPHRTRRIIKVSDNLYRMSSGGWRIFYSLNDKIIQLQEFKSVFSVKKLTSDGFENIDCYELYLGFIKKFS